jgi:hypothetical protein
MSDEARDAIREWLKVKDSKQKPASHGDYSGPLVFPFSHNAVGRVWTRALKEAGFGQDDPKTHYSIYHMHTLRKFFRTQMGLAGVPDMIVHAWMGHSAYLSKAYDRPKELAKLYRDHMGAVSVYLRTVERETQQVVVSQKEVSDYLTEGWRFIAKLDDDKVIVEGKAGQIIPNEENVKVEVKEPKPPSPEHDMEGNERVPKSDAVTPVQVPSKPLISDEQLYKQNERNTKEGQALKVEEHKPLISTLKPEYFTCTLRNQAMRFQDLPCIKDVMFVCPNKVCEKVVLQHMGIKK